jgi:1,4-dihydroxy-2-naphthoate polyprenyltransferase
VKSGRYWADKNVGSIKIALLMKNIRLFIQLTRPLFLVGAMIMFALGVGIARYLGATIDWGLYFIGQAWITMMQLGTHYLNEYFDSFADVHNPHRTPFSGGSGAIGPGKLPRAVALWAAITALTFVASFSVLLFQNIGFQPELLFLMILIFSGAFFYSVPPVQLSSSGYGELTTSIIVANLVPAFAFLLQAGEYHRLLSMSTFPLTTLHIAMMITFELPDYATDLKYEKSTLLVRLGWQRGMALHNLLIFANFVLLGIALFYGMPLSIVLPPLLLFPVGLFQIWTMNRIAGGAKPNWKILTLTGVLLFALSAYLIAFSYWIR